MSPLVYSYDINGNRTMTGYTTGPGNRLTSDGTHNYSYDDEGNLTLKTRISDGQRWECTWDHRNRLTQVLVKTSGGTVLTEDRFTYDVDDRRIGKWLDADGAGSGSPVQTWTAYDGANPHADFDSSGVLTYRYLYGAGMDTLLARHDSAGNTVWYLADKLSSVRLIVATEGSVLYQVTYDSYGSVLTQSGSGDRFKYTGREYDAELGQYYYRARHYGPGVGRFLSEDPKGFAAGDSNLYRYVWNGPTNFTDPTGLDTEDTNELPVPEGNLPPIDWDLVGRLNRELKEIYERSGNEVSFWEALSWKEVLIGLGHGGIMTFDGMTFGLFGLIAPDKWTKPLYQEYGNGSFRAGNVATTILLGAGALKLIQAYGGTFSMSFSTPGGASTGIPHTIVTSSATNSWYHAVGSWGNMYVIGAGSSFTNTIRYWNTIVIPVLNPGAIHNYVQYSTGPWTCITGALSGLFRCMLPW
jgi:RHS repeat-associated protein